MRVDMFMVTELNILVS